MRDLQAEQNQTTSILMVEAESAIERARSLRAQTVSNLAKSELLLSLAQEISCLMIRNDSY